MRTLAQHSQSHCARLPPAHAGWEEPFREQISAVRRREAAFIRRTARIKAFNMGLSAAVIPLVSGGIASWQGLRSLLGLGLGLCAAGHPLNLP